MDTALTQLPCVVCSKPAIGVCSSVSGAPISHAYCRECLEVGREEWNTLIGRMYGLTKDSAALWFVDIIKRTCSFYGKTEQQAWDELAKLEVEYDRYMQQKDSQ